MYSAGQDASFFSVKREIKGSGADQMVPLDTSHDIDGGEGETDANFNFGSLMKEKSFREQERSSSRYSKRMSGALVDRS